MTQTEETKVAVMQEQINYIKKQVDNIDERVKFIERSDRLKNYSNP